MTRDEKLGMSMVGSFVAVVCGGVFWIVSAITSAADEERARAWVEIDQRLELCAEVPGRDFEGCMERERIKRLALERHTDDVE